MYLSLCGCESRKLCQSALNLRVHLIPQWKAFYVDWRLSSMAKKKAKRGISSPPTWGFMTQTLRLQSWCLRVVGHSFISTSFTTVRWLKINFCFNWIYMFNLYRLIELHYLHVLTISGCKRLSNIVMLIIISSLNRTTKLMFNLSNNWTQRIFEYTF